MKQFEKRIRVLEKAAGQVDDNSFCALVPRAHARGERVRRIIVDPRKGETIESVCEREGITDDMPCIVREILVYPTGNGATEEKLETAGEASPAVRQRVSRPHERAWMAK